METKNADQTSKPSPSETAVRLAEAENLTTLLTKKLDAAAEAVRQGKAPELVLEILSY